MNFLQRIKTLNCCYFSPGGSFLFQGRRMCVKGQRQWTMNTVANKKKCLKSGLVIKLYTFVSCFSWCYFFHSSGGWPPFSYLLWLSLNHKIPEKVQKMLILKNYQKLSTINNMLIEFWGYIVIFLLKKQDQIFFSLLQYIWRKKNSHTLIMCTSLLKQKKRSLRCHFLL